MDTQGTLEKIEEAVNLNEVIKVAQIRKFNRFVRKGWVLPTVTVVGGAAIGSVGAYFLAKRKFKTHVETVENQLEELQSEQLQLNFERAEKDREFNKQIQEAALVVEKLKTMGMTVMTNLNDMATYGGAEGMGEDEPARDRIPFADPGKPIGTVTSVRETADGIEYEGTLTEEGAEIVERLTSDGDEVLSQTRRNIFDGDDTWDFELERNQRDPNEPYIIHVDEFVGDEMGFDSQSQLTYYEKDDVLTDSKDIPLYNHHAIVGDLRFGHGSGDPNIVYVRNELFKAEYEIVRDPGSYQEKILGQTIEMEFESRDLKHANMPRRFRPTD